MILDWWFEHQNKICRVEMDLSGSTNGKILFLGEVGGKFADITRFTAGVSYRYALYERAEDEDGYIRTVDAVPFYGEEREMAPELLAEATLKLEEGKKLLESSSQKRRRQKILAQRAYFEDALKDGNAKDGSTKDGSVKDGSVKSEEKPKATVESKPSYFETLAKEGLLGIGKTEVPNAKGGVSSAIMTISETAKSDKSSSGSADEKTKDESSASKHVKINDITVRGKRYVSLYYNGKLIKEYNVEEERYSEKYLSDQNYYDKTGRFFLRNIWIAIIVGVFLAASAATFLFYCVPVLQWLYMVIIAGAVGAVAISAMLLMFPFIGYVKTKNKMVEYEIISSFRRKKHTFNKTRRKFR